MVQTILSGEERKHLINALDKITVQIFTQQKLCHELIENEDLLNVLISTLEYVLTRDGNLRNNQSLINISNINNNNSNDLIAINVPPIPILQQLMGHS